MEGMGWEESWEESVLWLFGLLMDHWVGIAVGAVVIAIWRWFMRYKFRQRLVAMDADFKQRIAALEVEVRRLGGAAPAVVNVNNYGGDPSVIHGLRDELEAKDLELLDLRTLVGRLTPKPVPGTSATYVKLPEGTRIVTMDDGSIRMALPIRVSAAFEGGLRGELQGTIENGDPPEGDER